MTAISAELREFVAAKFGSTDQLDVFVLLYRQSEKWWTPDEVGTALDVAPQAAGMRLYLLSSAGILTSDGAADVRYRYASSPLIDVFASAVVNAYDTDRQQTYSIISGTTADPVKQLADAFRLRK